MRQNSVNGKTIVITGASSGIGERIAWHIAKHGGTPIMVARSQEKLAALKYNMEEEFGIQAHIYQADLQVEGEITSLCKQLYSEHKQIHGLINNAGAGMFQHVTDISWQHIERMMQLNVMALIRMTKELLPHFLQHRQGHVVNVASQAGKISTPKSAVYAATKHAVLGFTNSLRMEVKEQKIHVTSVNLGPVRTNFFTEADPGGTYQKAVERYMLDPDAVAIKIVNSLFTKKREINLPRWMEAGSKVYQLFPALTEKLLERQFNKK
ncbi:SDR family NAD(P)-dependent oxidoreductase [Lentibacillus sediminis]|uniref:SDR family NAD(P)-dependent oxidoreductase n=1 Tax=Lentibacillus sediminis TaxID=1940529 RepID=UPI000C1C346A|nr:SDR family oxidoreductase [Lentibacillus sediminis]